MARAQQSPTAHPFSAMQLARSPFRTRESTFALVAALFVLACLIVYSRDDAGLFRNRTTGESDEQQQHISYKPPTGVDPSIKPDTHPHPHPADADTADQDLLAVVSDGDSEADTHPSSVLAPPSPSAAPAAALGPGGPRAVVVESELIPNLVPLMLHFATILGPTWGIILFTCEDGYQEPQSPAFQRHLASGHIEVRFLPPGTAFTDTTAVSVFLTSPWLWEQVEHVPRVLLFQTDSVLCSRSEASVEDYFEWDYIGAPIIPQYGAGYNGGLSLRNPRAFLNVTRTVDFNASPIGFEDQFFYAALADKGAYMPPEEIAKTFAVETLYYETPLGYHQPQRWQPDKMPEIEDWCPEVKLLIGRRAT